MEGLKEGSGSEIPDSQFEDPDPELIISDPEHSREGTGQRKKVFRNRHGFQFEFDSSIEALLYIQCSGSGSGSARIRNYLASRIRIRIRNY